MSEAAGTLTSEGASVPSGKGPCKYEITNIDTKIFTDADFTGKIHSDDGMSEDSSSEEEGPGWMRGRGRVVPRSARPLWQVFLVGRVSPRLPLSWQSFWARPPSLPPLLRPLGPSGPPLPRFFLRPSPLVSPVVSRLLLSPLPLPSVWCLWLLPLLPPLPWPLSPRVPLSPRLPSSALWPPVPWHLGRAFLVLAPTLPPLPSVSPAPLLPLLSSPSPP